MAITAVPAGFAAGLFGIGGGLITVPILFYIFGSFGIDQSYLMHLAVGTSFSIIIPTSIVSVLTHKKHGSVDFNVIKNYGSFVISGVILGTIFAAYMKTKTLLIFFSTVVFILGTYLLLLQNNVKEIKKKFGLFSKIICGFVSGFISAPMGIGGAVMNVPILRYFGYPINKAIGSAAAIGFIIALFGAVGFLLSGTFMNTNLPYSVGFINIPTFLIFVPITTFMARIGANAAHRINKTKLQRLFGIFLYIVGTVFLYRHLSF
tara:strand:+ start:239 stop:1024 length:786 start_codon:yes stop_codon:yes gene_type:complete